MNEKKNYEVLLIGYCTVTVIGAEDEEHAMECAEADISRGDFEIEEYRVERELKTPQELESSRRHANVVSEAEE